MHKYSESEQKVRELLDRYDELPREAKEHSCSYLDAGEYALALDVLGDYVVENDLTVSRAFVDDMAKVYGFMGVAKPRNIAFLKERVRASNA